LAWARRRLWRRWRDGGVLFAKTFPDQTSVLAANDIARWFAEDRIREIVTDPAVAQDLIPRDHPIGTKRICTDAGYYATFNRDKGFGAVNWGRYSNPKVDYVIEQALQQVNDENRTQMLQQATRMAMDDLGIMPIHFQYTIWATRKGVLHPESWPVQVLALLGLAAVALTAAGFIIVAEYTGSPKDSSQMAVHSPSKLCFSFTLAV